MGSIRFAGNAPAQPSSKSDHPHAAHRLVARSLDRARGRERHPSKRPARNTASVFRVFLASYPDLMQQPLRILLADDHEVVRAGLRALLDADPLMDVVGEAANGLEACEKARELNPDVVVLDVSMPKLSGAEAAEQIRRDCPGVRVLALTMHDDRGHVTQLLEAGASGYVLKRSAGDELLRAIRIVAEVGSYVDPILSGRILRSDAGRPGGDVDSASSSLSEREEEVLRKIAWGHGNKDIAAQLGISTKTVETYKARIGEKLGLTSRKEIVRYALQRGWLSLPEK